MKTSERDRWRAILLGILASGLFLSVLYMTVLGQEDPTESTQYRVVDHIDGCEVIEWSKHSLATYKYFLRCPY